MCYIISNMKWVLIVFIKLRPFFSLLFLTHSLSHWYPPITIIIIIIIAIKMISQAHNILEKYQPIDSKEKRAENSSNDLFGCLCLYDYEYDGS